MKNIIATVVGLLIIAGAVYFLTQGSSKSDGAKMGGGSDNDTDTTEVVGGTENEGGDGESGAEVKKDKTKTLIATSVNGEEIIAYHYGTGDTELLFIGGIHGGYSWNTILVARALMDYLEADPSVIPENISVTVIPVLNPDGLYKTVGTTSAFTKDDVPESQTQTIPGRFNANEVDLNRNFDCDWEAMGTWKDKQVSGGTSAFSEPESAGIRDYVNAHTPKGVIVWYSSAGGVFASSCHNGVLTETTTMTNLYANASKYKAYETFDFYEITGDMVNWLAKESIPAISVLLTSHDNIEWDKNKKGIDALLQHYSN